MKLPLRLDGYLPARIFQFAILLDCGVTVAFSLQEEWPPVRF
jgi:hypothetical protein